MIEGVVVTPLRQILDERGKVMHMMRRDSSVFEEFGEIYFSCVHPGAIKAWHIHKR
jgi:dTDP-4-dehydrorhamnose 3,5-epimerase